MDLNLAGRTALITGASRGIGFAVAKCLIGEGVRVRIAARPGERIEKAAAALRAAGAKDFAAYGLDLSLTEKRAELEERCGDIDILINCAGIIPRQTIEEMSEEAWRQSWELKLFGSIDLTRRYYARMKARGGGVIINVIGSAGLRPDYKFAAGSVANSALMSLTARSAGSAPISTCASSASIPARSGPSARSSACTKPPSNVSATRVAGPRSKQSW